MVERYTAMGAMVIRPPQVHGTAVHAVHGPEEWVKSSDYDALASAHEKLKSDLESAAQEPSSAPSEHSDAV
jgi:hypothetical protein